MNMLKTPDDTENNQCHLSGSEREGNAEETHLSPDVQVDGVVFWKTPETRQSAARLHWTPQILIISNY